MPHCDCGFDFVKALRKGRPLLSYVLIRNEGYRTTIRIEHAITVEKDSQEKLRMIAQAAPRVGSLMRCPNCGAWLLVQPLKQGRGEYSVLRKQSMRGKSVAKRKQAAGLQRIRKLKKAGSNA